ncbi:unnamed protein product [Symbiodinium natans]|uniref:Hexosyltransferase n=1 Tax=Symbiodinium natans TaxID=878477 RepID=A0A812UN22_9DINO|nr:unnamed protein product [Symbiodinium natans]
MGRLRSAAAPPPSRAPLCGWAGGISRAPPRLLFFMATPSAGEEEALAWREEAEYGDLVEVGGPDSDPSVARDVTYVLDRPCARTYRLLHGSAWLAKNRPDHDYVMYLDDDSFLNIPRLVQHLQHQQSSSLAMGYIMETSLDWSQMHAPLFVTI